jgi:hypothetical protein
MSFKRNSYGSGKPKQSCHLRYSTPGTSRMAPSVPSLSWPRSILMDHRDEQFAVLEIDVKEVKNDMAYTIIVENGIKTVPKERHKPRYDALMAELGTREFGADR